jgi:hypothetical protein
LLGVLKIVRVSKSERLIANKRPPRLPGTSVEGRQIAGYGRLGNVVPEHEQLAVDSRRTPKEVLPSHSSDQFADLARNPRSSASPARGHSDVRACVGDFARGDIPDSMMQVLGRGPDSDLNDSRHIF